MPNKPSTSHVLVSNSGPGVISDEDLIRGFLLSLGASERTEHPRREYWMGLPQSRPPMESWRGLVSGRAWWRMPMTVQFPKIGPSPRGFLAPTMTYQRTPHLSRGGEADGLRAYLITRSSKGSHLAQQGRRVGQREGHLVREPCLPSSTQMRAARAPQ